MPRDLNQEEKPVQLTESPNSTTSPAEDSKMELVASARAKERADGILHPYTRPLTISDIESCCALEEAAFDKVEERASREKFEYRLSKCGDLSLGLFCTATPDAKISAETLKTGRPVETSRKNGAVSVLLAHIVATKSSDDVVTDNAMDYPQDWKSSKSLTTPLGHQEEGRTICIHSLGVLPGYQGRGLGRIILTSYMQQMNGAGIADRLAIIAHDHLVPYYEKFGFVSKGPSKAQFGGGGWIDMVFELKSVEARAMYG